MNESSILLYRFISTEMRGTQNSGRNSLKLIKLWQIKCRRKRTFTNSQHESRLWLPHSSSRLSLTQSVLPPAGKNRRGGCYSAFPLICAGSAEHGCDGLALKWGMMREGGEWPSQSRDSGHVLPSRHFLESLRHFKHSHCLLVLWVYFESLN